MTIGGFRVSEAQYIVLLELQIEKRLAVGQIWNPTAVALARLGLIEMFVPDAETYAMAARGRVRYYRLTKAGKVAVRCLKKLYKQAPVTTAIPAQPARRVRQRIVDT
jgi:hypothetical protein